MPTVYLVRHGQASFGAADYDVLSPAGELQSKIVGEELRRRGVRPDVVRSGTLRRQIDTAAAGLAAAGIDVECGTDARWNEYDHLALARHKAALLSSEPLTPQGFQRMLDDALVDWASGALADADESWEGFRSRVDGALDELLGSLGKGGIGLVFTSGGVISAICARLLDAPIAGYVAMNRVSINAGITRLAHGRSGTSLLSFNEHAHFVGDHRDLLTYR
ncbi:broad specificity phosphatase PhoE [Herbihabitans rhizosphaerae]|uniref:Broad specificity phosphatase PhoE n=1 Tax=Herbihabitans rhizosphaerae TaxID=1872711 RepID=A0A4V2ERC8_9PSEU|nr:histidine phosphatase family protein [Herbihabitans rhizosphaerae]RZS30402.1 broad specificity phosphatase PhoE [Herbihabitans rhizosphaerae]